MVHLCPVVMGTPQLVSWLTCLVSVEPKLPELAAELLLTRNVLWLQGTLVFLHLISQLANDSFPLITNWISVELSLKVFFVLGFFFHGTVKLRKDPSGTTSKWVGQSCLNSLSVCPCSFIRYFAVIHSLKQKIQDCRGP